MDKIWLIGDKFSYQTSLDYFKGNCDKSDNYEMYSYNHYEVREFFTNAESDTESHNVIGRLSNQLKLALNEHGSLPKLIELALDDDIMRCACFHGEHFSHFYTRILDALFENFTNSLVKYKEFLPAKAKSDHYPHFLFIAPPTHKFFKESSNKDRVNFLTALMASTSVYANMTVLKMVKHWSHEDDKLFNKDAYRFTSEGLTKYWLSVDSAIRFWFVAIQPKLGKAKKKSQKGRIPNRNSNQFKWYRNFNPPSRRRFPTPP